MIKRYTYGGADRWGHGAGLYEDEEGEYVRLDDVLIALLGKDLEDLKDNDS